MSAHCHTDFCLPREPLPLLQGKTAS